MASRTGILFEVTELSKVSPSIMWGLAPFQYVTANLCYSKGKLRDGETPSLPNFLDLFRQVDEHMTKNGPDHFYSAKVEFPDGSKGTVWAKENMSGLLAPPTRRRLKGRFTMENEITIEGEVYVKKSVMPPPEPPKIHFMHPGLLMDEAKVLGIGTVALKGDWVGLRVSAEYLGKVIKALRACSLSDDGLEHIDIVWTEDQPIVIGHLDKVRRKARGFIIAPRINTDFFLILLSSVTSPASRLPEGD